MFNRLRRAAQPAPKVSVPAGVRLYAIGDVHGRIDLLDTLLAMIDADDRARGPAQRQIVFLGDLIDRGHDSAGVVDRALRLSSELPNTRFLMGNHEEVFLKALDGDDRALRFLCRFGGRETILSYGLTQTDYDRLTFEELMPVLIDLVPESHREFLRGFEDVVVAGDYAFVHAGIRPGVPIDAQQVGDLRWIREPFLDHNGPLEKVIVHGHTITPEVEMRGNRIGIDTGAYESGRLTALGLENAERWALVTEDQ